MLRRSPFRAFAQVGSTLGSFTCVRVEDKISDLADPSGQPMKGTLWQHKETGTSVIYFSSSSSSSSGPSSSSVTSTAAAAAGGGEKACAIAFCTPAENESGATHILEHTVLCGSEKFPTVRDPFFKMLRRSLSTFMNAMTGPDFTVYPFSTVNEQDFFNILEVYLDATLHPLIRPLDFSQEAHRLKVLPPSSSSSSSSGDGAGEGETKTGPGANNNNNNNHHHLQRTGVVLNEMKGVLCDPMSFFYSELQKHFHQGTNYARCYGGDPLHIPKIQHTDLVSYYRRHYQKPVICLYDSAISASSSSSSSSSLTNETERKKFLEKSLEKILVEIQKPRKVLEQVAAKEQQKEEEDSTSPLEKLAALRKEDPLPFSAKDKFRFIWGPPEPVQQQQQAQSQEEGERGGGESSNNQVPARIGFSTPLETLIQSKDAATRLDHERMFTLQLLLHILLRPPSGALYKDLLKNGPNTEALASMDVNVVKTRIQKLQERKEPEEEEPETTSTILDLVPGCGVNHHAQVPVFFTGIQNVPVFSSSSSSSSTEKNQELARAKCELIQLICSQNLNSVAQKGINSDLVESALHEYELSLRTRDRQFAVNATINSVSQLVRGMDPFFTHETTAIDNKVAADIKTTLSSSSSSSSSLYFSSFIKEHLLEAFSPSNSKSALTAVAGSNEFVQKQQEESQKEISELSKSLSETEIENIKKLDSELLEAQKRVDDGGSLPSLKVSDISKDPVNFVLPSPSSSPSTENKNNNKLYGSTQSFVTNTAGLVYVNLLLPIPDAIFNSMSQEEHIIVGNLFSSVFAQLGLLDCSIAEQDIRIRKVCSGFSASVSLNQIPNRKEQQNSSSSSSFDNNLIQPYLRGFHVGFYAMPENVEKSIDLLLQCFRANSEGLWTKLIKTDNERKAMLTQLLTMIATDLESSVVHAGTQFAMGEAQSLAAERFSSSSSDSTSGNFGLWKLAGLTKSLARVRQLSGMKNSIASSSSSSSASSEDPLEKVFEPFFPFLEKFSQSVFQNNSGASAWCVAMPEDHEKMKHVIHEKLVAPIQQSSSPSSSSSTEKEDPFIKSEATLFKGFQDNKNSNNKNNKEEKDEIVRRIPLPGGDSSFVGCILPTSLHSNHPQSAPFALALKLASQEFLHREIREIGGAYGSMGSLMSISGTGGLACFGSYRDPTPDRTLDLLRGGGIRNWFKNSPPNERMLQEAKLSLFGGIDAPNAPQEAGEKTMLFRSDPDTFGRMRKNLLNASLEEVIRSVEEHLSEEATEKAMSCAVLGAPSK